jgi:hypothetical protein
MRARRFHSGVRVRGAIATVAAVAVLTVSAPARAQQAPEPSLVELRIGRLTSRTVEAWRVGDAALVPLGEFLSLAEIRWRAHEGVIEALVNPGPRTVRFAAGERAIQLGQRSVVVPEGDLLATGDELYASTAVLGEAFGIEFQVDWSELLVVVSDPSSLPVAQRIRRQAARLTLDGPRAPPEYTELEDEDWSVAGLLADWSMFLPTADPGGASGSLGLGAGLGRSALELVLRSEPTSTGRFVEVDASWTRVWREQEWLRQLRVGDVPATGPRPRTVRGVAVSNSPWVRPSRLGTLPFAGHLGPGWMVEAWRQGQLVAYDSVDAYGRYAFEVPVQYGENPVEFIAYGPDGEIHPFDRTVRVAADQLPDRDFEYGIAAGECRRLECDATANLDLRYGLSRRLTLGAGLEGAWGDSVTHAVQPYLSASATPLNAIGVELEHLGHAFTRAGLRIEPSLRAQVAMEAGWFEEGGSPVAPSGGLREQWILRGLVRPFGLARRAYVDAAVDRSVTTTGSRTGARLGASTYLRGLRLVPYVRMQTGGPAGTENFLGADVFALPRANLSGTLGRMWARGRLELEDGVTPHQAALTLALPLGRWGATAESGVRWFTGAGTSFTFQLTATMPWARSNTSAGAGAAGSYLTQSLSGSAVWDRGAQRVRPAPGPSLQRAGISGIVYLDRNANGLRDPDEDGLPGARLLVGSLPAATDSTGAFDVWDLPAFDPVLIQLDTLGLRDPQWVPASTALLAAPGPDGYRRLDVALVPAAVVEGSVRWSEGGRSVGGIPLHLVEEGTGRTLQAMTFRDGGFYLMGVRPGRWTLEVDAAALAALGAVATPVEVSITPDGALDGVAPLTLVLRPAAGY